MHEASLYEQVGDGKVTCNICNHRCLIPEDKTGICGVRLNERGTLYALNYGNAISAAVDPVEKKPLYHFLPGSDILSVATVGCNFRCDFCQNDDISQYPKVHPREIPGFELSPEEVVKKALENDCQSIAYTYTEPTIFIEYAHDTAKIAHLHGLKNVFVSNGYMTREAIDYIFPYLDAINVDLKSFDDKFYRKLCGASLEPILENIRTLVELEVWVEVTTLVIPGENDSPENLKKIADFLASLNTDIPWHISRFSPAYKMMDLPSTSLEKLKEAYDIGKKAGLKNVYIGNYPTHDYESTYCPKCGACVIERDSYNTINKLTKTGKCKECKTQVAGAFS